jgi:Flp pilus assembly protein TadD
LKPDDSPTQQILDHLVKEKAEADEQIAKLRSWLLRKPDDVEASAMLSFILVVADGDIAGAVNVLEDIVHVKPDDVAAVLVLARYLAIKETLKKAVADFGERVRRNPQSPGIHAGLGSLLQKRGDFDGAVGEFREAVHLKPDDPDFHMELSGALVSNGERESARAESALARQLSKPEVEEAAGANLLRALNVACRSYKSKYNSYPPDLKSLGMPAPGAGSSAAAADLIDPLLADGHRLGYQFTYKPGNSDSKGTIQTYEIDARWWGSGLEERWWLSPKVKQLSIDQSGVIK